MTNPWYEGVLVGFDVETTGTDVEQDRIVQAAISVVSPNEADSFGREWIINPGVDIPEEAAKVHGITNERVQAEGRDTTTCLAEIMAALVDAITSGHPIVTMNGTFDLTILDRECRRHDVPTLEERLHTDYGPMGPGVAGPMIDIRVIDKRLDQFRKGSRTLTDLCRHYGVKLDNAHTAYADAIAAVQVARELGQRYRYPLGRMSAAQLHTSQQGWYAEQVTSFAAYRARTGNPLIDISTDWPIRPLKTAADA